MVPTRAGPTQDASTQTGGQPEDMCLVHEELDKQPT